ncbi:Arc family DNA-binding protein [Acinetobacter sp. Ac_5812]|uniref:Arc family DNA-binding protein n=1 Tax=Acinetobacter sp. Ac_5812 TaxID=1848937 RepID=UPI00149076B7|nr:Arc family DNA-binding protein [Acinetobacter sp. Ac_5812]
MSENQKEPQYKLRWSEELRDKVMSSAKENNRSINQEIVSRLEQSFETPYIDAVSDAVIADLLEGTVSKLLGAIKDQGVTEDKIHGALQSLSRAKRKAP